MEKYISDGLITKVSHPEYPISIYNYTNLCQYNGAWDEITTKTRGLILEDGTSKVVGRGFNKIFNYTERPNSIEYPAKVYNKLDGSLGILYHYNGEFSIATRGAFTSPQAKWAIDFYNRHYADLFDLNPQYSYLFEIIYPENRIVVDYGDLKTLKLLAILDSQGNDVDLKDNNPGFPVVEYLGEVQSEADLFKFINNPAPGTETEGVILVGANGVRLKIKTHNYTLLHRLRCTLTHKNVAKSLADNCGCVYDLPDEFFPELRAIRAEVLNKYSQYYREIRKYYKEVIKSLNSFYNRKDFALMAESIQHKYFVSMSSLFFIFDNDLKRLNNFIWKQVEKSYDV